MKTEQRRLGLLGLILSSALALGACANLSDSTTTGDAAKLQSLSALDGKAPLRRTLDIQDRKSVV